MWRLKGRWFFLSRDKYGCVWLGPRGLRKSEQDDPPGDGWIVMTPTDSRRAFGCVPRKGQVIEFGFDRLHTKRMEA